MCFSKANNKSLHFALVFIALQRSSCTFKKNKKTKPKQTKNF